MEAVHPPALHPMKILQQNALESKARARSRLQSESWETKIAKMEAMHADLKSWKSTAPVQQAEARISKR
jgi:hypothetical protein